MEPDLLRHRILERLEATGKKRVSVSTQIGKGRDYLSNFLNGEKDSLAAGVLPKLAEVLECRLEYFIDPAVEDPTPTGPSEPYVQIIGQVGADTEGVVIQTGGQQGFDMAPVPRHGSTKSVAVEVVGDSMPWLARNGSIAYFDHQASPPPDDMIGYHAIVELDDGRVLIKRLLRGSRSGLYTLASEDGPPIEDVQVVWAAEPIAIVPPREARRIIVRAGERQVA